MILFTCLVLALLILTILVVLGAGAGALAFIFTFGDVIICIALIYVIIKHLINRKK